ncbi:hypothetical protein [Zunongwangia sp.]|uniref:hypothetical protein n=1 Tax=Zunongwangia sp. TaxID=1965325 RepID=UPI003AA8250C
MKKHYILALLFVFSSFLNTKAQQYFSIPNDLKESHRSVKDAFTITNPNTKTLSVFIDDNKTINAYIYNENSERIDSLVSDGLPKKYSEIIGYIQKEQKTILYLKHRNGKQFGSILFDFKNRKTKEIEFDFKLRGEQYVESLSKNNKLYLITTPKKRSVLKLYEFEGLYPKKHLIPIDYTFRIADNEKLNLYGMLKNLKKSSPDPIELRKIDTEFPVSVELAGAMNKLYETDKGFELTLDKSIYETYIIAVDLKDYKADITRFEKPKYSTEERFFSKSFLLDDNIYQIVGNADELFFEAKNRNTANVLKKLHVNKDDVIPFKNTPIIQDKEGSIFAPHRELKKTSKFLKKIDNEDISVAVQKKNNKYIITMGSFTKPYYGSSSTFMMAPTPGMGMGAPTMMTVPIGSNINLSLSSYLTYAYGKSVRIKCLFDSNFNHIEGEIPENAFDRIKKYAKLLHDPIAENVFEWNNSIYYGYYNKEGEAYRIMNFSK